MAAITIPLALNNNGNTKPVNGVCAEPQYNADGDINYTDGDRFNGEGPEVDMPPRDPTAERLTEAMCMIAESLAEEKAHRRAMEARQMRLDEQRETGGGKHRNWLLAGVAVLGLVGPAGGSLVSSAIWVGNKQAETQRMAEDMRELKEDLRNAMRKADEATTWVITTREMFDKRGVKTVPLKDHNKER